MFCNTCGAELKDGQKFCTSCGAEAKSHLVAPMKPSVAMPANAKPVPWATKRMKILLWVLGGFILLAILSAIVLASLNTAREKGRAAQGLDWATITSAEFTVELPRNPEYDPDDTPDSVYGYAYSASENDEHVYYVVKYEDYQAVAEKVNVDLANADEATANDFLKGLADSTVKEFKLTNFSSQFITSHEHNAIKFSGEISNESSTAHVEGVIILVGAATYHVISLADEGYTSQFERVLNSMVIVDKYKDIKGLFKKI